MNPAHRQIGLLVVVALLAGCKRSEEGEASDLPVNPPPECADGYVHCGASCTNVTQDPANCGACGTRCDGQVCSQGECKDACDAGLTDCAASCVDVTGDPAHCGACGVSCAVGQVCTAGECACDSGRVACGDVCADVATSVNHCGACDQRCAPGQTCAAGTCTGEAIAWVEPILDATGAIDPVAYAAFAGATDLESVDQRLGPDYEFFHTGATEELPLVYERSGLDGLYYDGDCRLENFDRYWSGAYAGNILYAPDDPADAGIDRVRFSWRYTDEPNAATCYIFRTDLEKLEPDENLWFTKSPDPCVEQATWAALSGGSPPAHPVALERSRYDWSHAGIVAFPNGLVGATGYGNNDDKFPALTLGPNQVPTAVAVSNNNEFAFVTVWDTARVAGKLAVIALESRGPFGFHEADIFRYIGLVNLGAYTRMKLLGFVDLPFAAPSSVSAMTDGAPAAAFIGERFAPEDRPFPHDLLDTQAARDFWANEPPAPQGYRARGGYVMVASRAENQVAFIDLLPLIRWFREMYFTTPERFAQTADEGEAPDQWPFTFEVAPEARPVVASVIDVPQPTAVAAGWSQTQGLEPPHDDPRERAFIGTLNGELLIYEVGGWLEGQALVATELRSVAVGRNPTSITTAHEWGDEEGRNQLIVVSRGDREVGLYTVEGEVTKTLRDQRLLDPISAQTTENHDLRVADFHGKQVLTYLYRSVGSTPLDPEYIWRLGADGNAPFEFTHAFPRPGGVFSTSSVLFF